MSKDKGKAATRWYEGHNHIIKYNALLVGDPLNWRAIIPKKFSYFCEGSEPYVRLPSLEI